ncbi:MAG: magnesium transporter CorA family protein [Candidatus Nanoarchaeia archaeon]|jgi:magnesium transporter
MREIKFGSHYCRLFNKDDNELLKLAKKLGMDEEDIEDLLEEQRPNMLNFNDYSIITLLFPNMKTIKNGEFMIQVTLILTKKGVNMIVNEDNKITNKAFDDLNKIKFEGITSLVSHLIDSIREESIEILDKVEIYLNKKEREIIHGKRDKKLLIKMHDLRETFYFISKGVIGNVEVIRELLTKKTKFINPTYFSEHQEDRALYFIDLIDYLRESVRTNIETYVSLMSHRLNEQMYKITILGSILLIPTILSSFFGMNVELPAIGFWSIIGVSVLLSTIIYLFLRNH